MLKFKQTLNNWTIFNNTANRAALFSTMALNFDNNTACLQLISERFFNLFGSQFHADCSEWEYSRDTRQLGAGALI